MIAAIYARKSTEQTGVADEQKSVARQIDHARRYAERKGWTVDEASVFVDDGISGAEFANRPGFLRLMNALKPRPPFQVLVMSEESRLGREAIETAYALKQLVQAGVRVFFYLEDRERTLDSPTDKIMLSLTAFADELEREKARQRTYDAMLRKAKAGHVTGGRVFGYDNVEVARRRMASGRTSSGASTRPRPRSCAGSSSCAREGVGQTRIAKQLNAERRDRAAGAAGPAAGVGAVVRSRGAVPRRSTAASSSWNQTRKRNQWGQQQQTARPAGRVDADRRRRTSGSSPMTSGQAAHDAARRRRGRSTNATRHGQRRPHRDRDSKYLLPGLRAVRALRRRPARPQPGARRATRVLLRLHGALQPRAGRSARTSSRWPMDGDRSRRCSATIAATCSSPTVVEAIVAAAREMLRGDRPDDRDRRLERELAAVERELARLTEAIAAGGEHAGARWSDCGDARRTRRAASCASSRARSVDAATGLARASSGGCASSLARLAIAARAATSAQARQVLRKLLTAPIVFTPFVRDGSGRLRFEGGSGDAAVQRASL